MRRTSALLAGIAILALAPAAFAESTVRSTMPDTGSPVFLGFPTGNPSMNDCAGLPEAWNRAACVAALGSGYPSEPERNASYGGPGVEVGAGYAGVGMAYRYDRPDEPAGAAQRSWAYHHSWAPGWGPVSTMERDVSVRTSRNAEHGGP